MALFVSGHADIIRGAGSEVVQSHPGLRTTGVIIAGRPGHLGETAADAGIYCETAQCRNQGCASAIGFWQVSNVTKLPPQPEV